MKVSLIIPCREDLKNNLNFLLKKIESWSSYPDEIIIIDSTPAKAEIDRHVLDFLKTNNVSINVLRRKNFYPGNSRNLGILNAEHSTLAFLDLGTIPPSTWLQNGLELIQSMNLDGIWGETRYLAKTNKEKVIRAATFGDLPIQTFPGSIIKKEVFFQCGLFIENVRAGEDADWIKRLQLHGIQFAKNNERLAYSGLQGARFKDIIYKWHRNYKSASIFPYIAPHRDIYFLALSLAAVTFAYNWNWFWLDWKSVSSFYLPNVTKISMGAIIGSYIFFRGYFLPKKKGAQLNFLLPLNFIRISFLPLAIDIVKLAAFLQSKLSK